MPNGTEAQQECCSVLLTRSTAKRGLAQGKLNYIHHELYLLLCCQEFDGKEPPMRLAVSPSFAAKIPESAGS